MATESSIPAPLPSLPKKRPASAKLLVSSAVLVLLCVFTAWQIYVVYDNSRALTIMRAISTGFHQYANEHDKRLPALGNPALLEKQLAPYGSEMHLSELDSMLVRPGSDIPHLGNAALAGKKLSDLPTDKRVVVLYQSRPKHGKRVLAVWIQVGIRPLIMSETEWHNFRKSAMNP